MNHATRFTKLALLLIVAGALALAGCGGDDGVSPADHQAALDAAAAERAEAERQAAAELAEAERKAAEEREAREQAERDRMAAEQAEADRLAAINTAMRQIAAAETAEDAQMIYDAVMNATALEDAALMDALEDRKMELATMQRMAAQRMALSDAAGALEALGDLGADDALDTAEEVAAARAAINALQMALDDAMDVGDADKAMYQTQLQLAEAHVMPVETAADKMARINMAMQAIADAETEAEVRKAQADLEADVDNLTVTENAGIQAAVDMRIAALATMAREADQKMNLMTAADSVDTSEMMTAEEIATANTAIAALKMAIADAMDVSDADKTMYQAMVDTAEANVMTSQRALDHDYQTMKLANAVTALQAIDLGNLNTQAKIDAADAAVTKLQEALTAAVELTDAQKVTAMTELATARRTVMMAQGRADVAGQMQAIADAVKALKAIDLDDLMTQAKIDAANKAIMAVDAALNDAVDLTNVQKADATFERTLAEREVMKAQEALEGNIDTQKMALKDAYDTLVALGDLSADDALDTADEVTAARTAVDALKTALDNATHVSDADKAKYQTRYTADSETVKTAETGMGLTGRMATQRKAITDAVTTATAAVTAVTDTATDAQVKAANDALTALQAAIDGAEDIPAGDTKVAEARGTLTGLRSVLTGKEESRTAAMDEAQKAADATDMADAMKLHLGLEHGLGDTDNVRTGASDNAGVISVTIGTAAAVPLAEDKKTTVADLHGWKGEKHTAEPTGDVGTYEAYVYSNVGDPTEGDPFNEEYTLDGTTGETADITTLTGYVTGRVASSDFDQSAGTKTYDLPANTVRVMVPGMYHGVPGTYYCTPTDATTKCSSTIAESGFTLAGGTWTFKPTTATTKVTSVDDTVYASYGWWLHKSEDGKTYTASAFATARGTVTAAAGIDTLRGTATYTGGAAGKYALYSATGGTNDAGHFTAKATLEADFNADMISGTIDEFMGADGMPRSSWSVELMKQGIGATGTILGDDGTGTAGTDEKMTKWTIDGTAADAAGQWSGTLYDNGDDGVPKVGTGTFDAEYSTSGRMTGAFGVNVE